MSMLGEGSTKSNNMEITEKKEDFTIFNKTTHKFGFKARMLILFGKPLIQSLTLTVDKEVTVIKTKSSGYIPDLFPKKSKGGMEISAGEK